jgi:hypothetical protein
MVKDGLAGMGGCGRKVRSISNLKTCWKVTGGLWLVLRRERGAGEAFEERCDHRRA